MTTPDEYVVPTVTPTTTTAPTHRRVSNLNKKVVQQQQQQPKEHVVRNSILAGILAGITSTLACHPFDVLRTKMQAATLDVASATASTTTKSSSISTASRAASLAARGAATITASSGPMKVLAHTIKHGGISALYTGFALPVAAQAVYKATIFTVNNVIQRFLVDWHTQQRLKTGVSTEPYRISLMDRFWCGFVGGAVNGALFVTPVEFVRNQLITQHTRLAQLQALLPNHRLLHDHPQPQPRVMGSLDVIRNTISKQGIVGLWRGISMTMARDSIGCGFYFVAMALTQEHCASQNYNMSPLHVNLWAGVNAGLAFWAVALPLDTLKTWVQTGATASATDALRQSYHQRGIVKTAQQLTRGWQVAFGRGAPSAAITIASFEVAYQYLQKID